jgi:hypothetical protein
MLNSSTRDNNYINSNLRREKHGAEKKTYRDWC